MIRNKLLDAVGRLQLDLAGKTVLTEAATGAYVVTPVLAAIAGAKVLAFTKDTAYGTVADVRVQTQKLLEQFPDISGNVELIESLTPDLIAKADIITNSGHLRPLNENKLKHCQRCVVIPLMYEAWEWRDGDVDIEYCRSRSISVGATNERHPVVDVFSFLGDMALKMIFDAGLCPYKNSFVLICNNDFGPFMASTLSKVCGALAVCDKKENKSKYADMPIEWIGDFPSFSIPEGFRNCEAVIFTAYPFDTEWIGSPDRPISIHKLKKEINDPFILRFAGDISEEASRSAMRIHPTHVKPGHMGILPSAIGYDPVIRLQSGGLKVGELMIKHNTHFKSDLLVEMM